ncbi:hypothetical protein DPMN_019843 [Dreissena polymorpha]|uniref:Uncharacterized protein n=1 Tax=Dreissena polymorpha TaxID=45954 RepID=A0A9D4S9N6_DREPO|nr:hypothetical protein DPMN_019843 [Dreissena polymorpha]
MSRRTDAKIAAKCDLPPHTDAASTADLASTRCALLPRIAEYRSLVQFLAGALEISEMLQVFPTQLEMYWYETQRISSMMTMDSRMMYVVADYTANT